MFQHHTSAHRCNRLVRVASALGCALFLGALRPAAAQEASELFRGTWQVETPADGSLVVLLKGKNLAAYFWGDNADRTVYTGSWSGDGSRAEITWEAGDRLVIERSGAGFTAEAFEPGGATRYSAAPARQLPQEMLGQWSKPPTREDEMRSEREQARGFFGIWKVGGESPNYVFVEPDRSAASTFGPGDRGQRGQWAKQGSELHIIWDSGEYSILRENSRGFAYQQVDTGQVIEEDESPTQPAIRTLENQVPADWMAAYRGERADSAGGIAFASRKEARDFYRGDWLVRRGENRFERVSLSRFGGLATTADRSLGGQWRLSGQDVFMRWDDGMRKILSPVGQGFVLYEYRPGRPLDGVPHRVLPAAPADGDKFEEHLAGRADVARQMRETASAAGIDPAGQEDAGWGRSFARWVWPFEADEAPTDAETLLDEGYAEAPAADPWWWPFWSEKPVESEAESPAAPTGEIPGAPSDAPEPAADDAPEAPAPETNPETPTPVEHETAPGGTRDWAWPF